MFLQETLDPAWGPRRERVDRVLAAMHDPKPRFRARTRDLNDTVRRYELECEGSILEWREVLDLWRGEDQAFRMFFIKLLRNGPFGCFRFETPPVTASASRDPFQFVLVDSPGIDLKPDCRDFQAHFDEHPEDVLVFANLGGDAIMIVPRPYPGLPGYPHLAAFARLAPLGQQLQLWETVGETVYRSLTDAPRWLNTAGGGVPWLHVRLDSRPKYYVFGEYRKPPES